MRIKVLMLGPGEGLIGGISTFIQTLKPVLEQKVNLVYFPTVKRRSLKYSGILSLENIALAFAQYARFILALSRFHPQIIHLNTSQGIAWLKDTFYVLAAKILQVRLVLHVHAADFDELYGGKSRLLQLYTRKVMGLADAVIAVSEEWKMRLGEIISIRKVFTFRNCISIDFFSPDFHHRSNNGAKGLFLGTIGPRKGAFDLLEAMASLQSKKCPIQVWLAGDEERAGDLLKARARCEELKLADRVQLIGPVWGEKKAELLRKANLFVLPSYNEGLPIAVLEAMAAGLPIVSTLVGGIPEVIKDSFNGFLITPGDIPALSKNLALLANNPQLREVMGRRSREIAQQEFDVKPYVERLFELYQSLVQHRRKGL